jgi:ribosomal subunit interface protein
MTFPSITFKHTHTDEARHLETVVEHKLAALKKYLTHQNDVRCEVEFAKEAANQSGQIYRVEMNLWSEGTLFRAEATDETFEKAIDRARDDLDHELRKAHDKRDSLFKRSGRAFKEMMRWGK